jgi:hypothetical protein
MQIKWNPLSLIFLIMSSLYGREPSFDSYLFNANQPQPWFTGPLLTPSGHVVPEKHVNFEPYIYWTQAKGTYGPNWKSHSHPTFDNVLFQGSIQIGVLSATEFDLNPQFIYNHTQGQHMWRVSDIPISLAFQLLYDQTDSWYPGIKLKFGANVPLGKYDHLDPLRLETDNGGIGTWIPNVGVTLTRLHHIAGAQYLSWRFSINYGVGTPVSVNGLSVFGGSSSLPGIPGTRGTVYPGNQFLVLGGLEYSLSQNWVLALDLQYQHNNKNRFSGYSPLGTKPTRPSRELFALAPAIEYNWSDNLGIIAGPWFSVAGRNTQKFISYVVAINVYN